MPKFRLEVKQTHSATCTFRFELYIENLLKGSLKPIKADFRTRSRVGSQGWWVVGGAVGCAVEIPKGSRALTTTLNDLSVSPPLSPHHLSLPRRPALPEKAADVSTLNEVGYQIRI